jgi:hypothetical protein
MNKILMKPLRSENALLSFAIMRRFEGGCNNRKVGQEIVPKAVVVHPSASDGALSIVKIGVRAGGLGN